MLSFKQKRRYKFLAKFFTILQFITIGAFIMIMFTIFNNWFGLGGTAHTTMYGVLMILVASYFLGNYYVGERITYLNRIKKYRLNRVLHLVIHAIVQLKYDDAIQLYNDLMVVDGEHRKIAYNALIFSMAHSKKPDHKITAQYEIARTLNEYSYKDLF